MLCCLVSPIGGGFVSATRRRDLEGSKEMRTNEEFVVHRGRTVPTLYGVDGATGRSVRPTKEKLNTDTKAEERGEQDRSAGVPSFRDDRKTTFAGRRSRRNSVTDDSHLTIENFGGSQDNLSLLGRNPDKEPVIVHGRRPSFDSPGCYSIHFNPFQSLQFY